MHVSRGAVFLTHPVYKNLQMLPENLSMTDHFKKQEQTDQKQEIKVYCWGRKQNSSAWKWMNLLPIAACVQQIWQNKDDNKWLWWYNWLQLQCSSAWQKRQNHGQVWPEPMFSISTCYYYKCLWVFKISYPFSNLFTIFTIYYLFSFTSSNPWPFQSVSSSY